MKKAFAILAVFVLSKMSYAQNIQGTSDTAAIKQTVNTLLDAIRKNDSSLARSVLSKGMILQFLSTENGEAKLSTVNADELVKIIGTPDASVDDERIVYDAIKIDGGLACVWAPYKFFIGTQFNHCGVDVFQLMRSAEGWKVIYIGNTTRKNNCIE
jgi:hypothetical protein